MSVVGIEELLKEAVAFHGNDDDNESYKEFFRVVDLLRPHGMNAVLANDDMIRRGSVVERSTAADIFGRLVFEASNEIHQACFERLATALEYELGGAAEAEVVESIARAFGHMYDERAVPLLVNLVSHPSENVRRAVAAALPHGCNWGTKPEAVDALVILSTDADGDIRDWACFGLGQLDDRSNHVREALAARLDDEHNEARCEALVALAKFGDERVVERLLSRLDANDVWTLEVEAAGVVADPRLHPLLVKIKTWWSDDGDIAKVDDALRRCDPTAAATAAQFEREFLGVLKPQADAIGVVIESEGSYPSTLVRAVQNGTVLYEERFWDFDDPLSSNDAEAEASNWMLTLQNLD